MADHTDFDTLLLEMMRYGKEHPERTAIALSDPTIGDQRLGWRCVETGEEWWISLQDIKRWHSRKSREAHIGA